MDEFEMDELLQEEVEDDDEEEEKQAETGEEDNGDEAQEEEADAGEENADTAEEDAGNDEDDEEENDENEGMGPVAMLKFLQTLPEAEVRRHEQFRRSHFDKNVVKRCMTQVIEEASVGERRVPSVHVTMSIAMSGLAKMFVGELIAEARKIMAHAGDTGPIRPHHLREAHRKYYKRNPLLRGRNRRRLFK